MASNEKPRRSAPDGKAEASPRPRKRNWLGGRFTLLGIGAPLLAAIIFIAAINTGTNLLYVMACMLLSLWIVAPFAGEANLKGLVANQNTPSEASAGEKVELSLGIRNPRRWLPSFGIGAERSDPRLAPNPWSVPFLMIGPGETAWATAEATFLHRGLVRIEEVDVISSFPFGFFERKKKHKALLEILVLPAMVECRLPPLTDATELGSREREQAGHGASIHAIREYQEGDPAKDIHWKLSAKGQGLKLKEYEREEAYGVQLILDEAFGGPLTATEKAILENQIGMAAWMAKQYLQQGREVALWTRGGEVSRGMGPNHLRRILRALALLDLATFEGESGKAARPQENMIQIRVSEADSAVDTDGAPAAGRNPALPKPDIATLRRLRQAKQLAR